MKHLIHRTTLLLCCCCLVLDISAQKAPIKTGTIDEVTVEADKKKPLFKRVGLYDGEEDDEFNIRGYYQLTIFENSLSDEFWTSDGEQCIKGQLESDEKDTYLSLTWNKDQSDCDWVGFGFGWDGWAGKDMGYVMDTIAIQLTVRATTDQAFTNIPWAFSIEDYAGAQAWLGYNTSFLMSKEITQEWTTVEIPFMLFPFDEKDVDVSNVKQLLVQVFAAGTLDIKSIKIVPFSRKLKKEIAVKSTSNTPTIDGDLDDWNTTNFETMDNGNAFAMNYSEDNLYFAFKVKDASPRQNNQEKGKLWNGDAIEIAFSTNPNADEKRNFLLLSDQHIGLNCGEKPYLWNWKDDVTIDAKFEFKATEDGYQVELAVPVKELFGFVPKKGSNLDLEIAIDQGNGTTRKQQLRWNSGGQEGFNETPQRWGKLILE